jgi:flagellar brake protein
MESKSNFAIKNEKEIFNKLSLLHKKNCLLAAHFGDNDETFITTLLDINAKKKILALDYGPKEYINKQVLASKLVTFKTDLTGIQIQFSGKKLTKAQYGKQSAFVMPIPDTIIWRQRREFYRVKTPFTHPACCKITLEDDLHITLPLNDISISGFALLNETKEISNQLIPMTQFENCTLTLPEAGEGNISIIIRNKIAANPAKPDKIQRIGCEFTKIEPTFQSTIQRYMQRIELKSRSK